MSVTSIAGSVAAFTLQPLGAVASSDKQAKGAIATNDHAQLELAVQPQMTVESIGNKKVSPENKPSTDIDTNGSHKQPARAMSHIVQTYNIQGKVRVKYMDSHNNVIYQIPSEMVAKTQDLMTNTQAASNIKV